MSNVTDSCQVLGGEDGSLIREKNNTVIVTKETHSSTSPYTILSSGLEFGDGDQRHWWSIVAPIFQALLVRSGYDITHQYQYLALIYRYVIPALGPKPDPQNGTHWEGFMTDDFSPFEPSINLHGNKATVRLGLEPIGHLAGTETDPLNQSAIQRFIKSMHDFPDVTDLQLWDHFSRELHVAPENAKWIIPKVSSNESLSQNLFAFDFGQGKASLKAYFFPYLKSLETGTSEGRLIFDSILKLDGLEYSIAPALALVQQYAASEASIRVEAVSFDCTAARDSRIKVYFRSPFTSFKKMSEVYTLGGRLNGATTQAGLRVLKDLWPLILNVDEAHSDEHELPLSSHRTAGFVYNYEIRPGKAYPEPKVYIPLKHYSKNDTAIAKGLATYFQQQGWTDLARSYVDDLRSIFQHHNLDTETGTQGWISYSYKETNGPYLTVYYSPKVYLAADS